MSMRMLKRAAVRALRRLGVVASSITSSPEGRIKLLLKTYRINTVLDVGANKGQFATMIRGEAKFGGGIVSFEPMQAEFSDLQRAAHDDQNWKVINCGLGDVEMEMSINVAGNSASSSLLPASTRLFAVAPEATYVGNQTVRVRTLDAVYDELRLEHSRVYLKIDAQGFESKILAGAERSLRGIDTVQLEMPLVPMYEGALPFGELFQLMNDKGYRLVHLIPGLFDRMTGELLECDGIFHRASKLDA